MARRWRVGLAGSPKVVGVATAVMLIIAVFVTGRWLNSGGGLGPSASSSDGRAATSRAPYRIGGKVECPPDWPVLAVSDHTSYPAGHPSRPPASAAAVACYRTVAEAARAGYPPAPLPAGAVEVGGVYLAQTSRGFRASCRQAADRLGFRVPCPGLLPTTPPGLPLPKLCEPASCQPRKLLAFILEGFVVPADYIGAPGTQPYGALAIYASTSAEAASRTPLQCSNERRTANLTVHGTAAVLATCHDAQEPDRVLLHWSHHGTFVLVSVLGATEVNQRLAVALADRLLLVPPSG